MDPSCKLELARFLAKLGIQDGVECGNNIVQILVKYWSILVKYWSNISQILHTYCQNIVNQFCFLQHQNTRNNRDSQKGEPTLMGGTNTEGGGAVTWLF